MGRRKPKPRGYYRPDFRADIAAIEERRRSREIGRDFLALRAGMSLSTYNRMLRHGRAFRRHIRALKLALRSIEAERRIEQEMFPCV